jgi:hypothetical protein
VTENTGSSTDTITATGCADCGPWCFYGADEDTVADVSEIQLPLYPGYGHYCGRFGDISASISRIGALILTFRKYICLNILEMGTVADVSQMHVSILRI